MQERRPGHRIQIGFTVVETMVALVVLAIGMLGIAALYIESLRSGQTAVSYSNAVTLASAMADKIRANGSATVAYTGAAVGNGTGGTAGNNCVNGLTDCSAAQLAADDWFWWYEDVKAQLPQGRSAVIQVTNTPPLNTYSILLQWPERGQTQLSRYLLTFSI